MIKIVSQPLSQNEVRQFLGRPFEDMVKFVADIDQGLLALGGELHADAEKVLLEQGSAQADLWGGNFYPDRPKGKQIEYTSLINIRPSAGNLSLEVKDEKIRHAIQQLLGQLIL